MATGLVRYPLLLRTAKEGREECWVSFDLPPDLTDEDVARIHGVLKTLVEDWEALECGCAIRVLPDGSIDQVWCEEHSKTSAS